ncbi:septal ring lytic transglycosylase RlpA family protein [Paraferrimonas sedimenticola]|uniref:Endolytic peptidoglycan transglycosylase RlpA n=1 Tax=Paraferrimonas sedimenticola TaxID=375674 RepID=A0AA37RZE9_9GAMM|nr:septal ring lytic transglycosylase RlpA family protein [Paraferrimonas sedimenticola]GLP98018.1 endolytic peptidoglycan transglycosylase RlpA [Paraferrimonas sedimenticola]
MRTAKWLWLAVAISFIAGCSGNSGSRYSQANDSAPNKVPDLAHVEDAQPKYEPYSRQGNRDYKLRGQEYRIITNAEGFTQKGQASWYGKKFHGHLTSNGETYDMYSMSAAHKTLPLPSYVEVKNLDNGRVTVVRVNDRGPFHPGRIIDLSYAAANKLGVVNSGVANVEIRVLTPEKQAMAGVKDTHGDDLYFVQVLASGDKARVESMGQQLSKQYDVGYRTTQSRTLHKLQLGPLSNAALANGLIAKLHREGFPTSFLITSQR